MAIVVLVLVALAVALGGLRGVAGRPGLRPQTAGSARAAAPALGAPLGATGARVAVRLAAGRCRSRCSSCVRTSPAPSRPTRSRPTPTWIPGRRSPAPAPDFTLGDQFGQPVSLHSFRGKVVILAFNDSECTTICPLTTTAMLDAKAMLGAAGSRVQLLGVDANPKATSVEDVLVLLAAARDAARLALPHRLARRS